MRTYTSLHMTNSSDAIAQLLGCLRKEKNVIILILLRAFGPGVCLRCATCVHWLETCGWKPGFMRYVYDEQIGTKASSYKIL